MVAIMKISTSSRRGARNRLLRPRVGGGGVVFAAAALLLLLSSLVDAAVAVGSSNKSAMKRKLILNRQQASSSSESQRRRMLAEHETSATVFWKNVETMFQSSNNNDDDRNTEANTPPRLHQQQQQPRFLLLTILIGFVVWECAGFVYDRATLSRRLGMPVMTNPPEGPSLPIIGQALNFVRYRPWDLMMSWHRTYGPIVCFPLLGACMFSIGSPALLKVVLQSKIEAVKKDVQKVMKPFLVILGKGIVTSEGQQWMKQRLKMSVPLRQDVLEMIPRQTLLALQRLLKVMDDACDTGAQIPMGSSLRHLTLQVISGTFLSLSAEESDSTFAKYYLPIVDESNSRVWHPYRSYLFFIPAFWNQIYNVHRLNAYVSKLIRARWQQRRQEYGGDVSGNSGEMKREQDILDRVISVVEKEFGSDLPAKLPETVVRQLRDEMKTFMLAGHETSAAMMTWAIYELMGNASLLKRVADEAESVLRPKMPDVAKASVVDVPSADCLAGLELSEATLKESLRKYSVVPTVARRTIQDLYMESEDDGSDKHRYLIPKGSSILLNIQAVHHDARYWPDPMRFDPDRFLGGQKIEPFTFLPFIAGPRNCLGQYLALLESKMVIGVLVQRYNFSLPCGQSVKVGDWDGGPDADPRHRYMVPVIPQEELMVHISRK